MGNKKKLIPMEEHHIVRDRSMVSTIFHIMCIGLKGINMVCFDMHVADRELHRCNPSFSPPRDGWGWKRVAGSKRGLRSRLRITRTVFQRMGVYQGRYSSISFIRPFDSVGQCLSYQRLLCSPKRSPTSPSIKRLLKSSYQF